MGSQVAGRDGGFDLRKDEVDRCLRIESGRGEGLVGHVMDSLQAMAHAPKRLELEATFSLGLHAPEVDQPHSLAAQVGPVNGLGCYVGPLVGKAQLSGVAATSCKLSGGAKATT